VLPILTVTPPFPGVVGIFSVGIRNPGNKYIRVANSEEGTGGDYVTIAPKFSRRFMVTNQDRLWVRRDDGLVTPYRIELVAEHL